MLVFFDYGNNPEPLKRYDERCCDDCNAKIVVPERIRLILSKMSKIDSNATVIDGEAPKEDVNVR
jgi:hypothetical protein